MAWAAANEAVRHWSDVAVVHTTRLRYYRMAWVGGTERASLGARAADGRRRRVSGRLAGVAPRQASRWWQVGAMGLTKGRMHYSTILASGTTTRWPEGTARSHQVRSGCGRDGRWPDRYDSVQCVLVPSACTQPRPALPRTMPSGRQRVVVGAMWSLVVRYYHTTYTTTPLRYLPTLVEWYHTTSKVKDYAPPELAVALQPYAQKQQAGRGGSLAGAGRAGTNPPAGSRMAPSLAPRRRARPMRTTPSLVTLFPYQQVHEAGTGPPSSRPSRRSHAPTSPWQAPARPTPCFPLPPPSPSHALTRRRPRPEAARTTGRATSRLPRG